MLYRPLFWTSYWCEDWLALAKYRNATTILITSASSKTAFCLAYLVGKRRKTEQLQIIIIGLTSKANAAFTNRLGLYDQVLEYDSFPTTATLQSGKFLYVDVAGNRSLNERMNRYFMSDSSRTLLANIALGYSNVSPSFDVPDWKDQTRVDPGRDTKSQQLGPPPVENFFMPEWLEVRKNQLSRDEIFRRQNKGWVELMQDCVNWVKIERVYGGRDVERAYQRIANGQLSPETGYIWSLWGNKDTEVLLDSKL